MTSQSDAGIARAELGATKVSVRVDGEWCRDMAWYTADLPVFTAPDGSEIDIRDDGSILYETPGGAVQEIDPDEETDGVRTFRPLSVYPADKIEVHETHDHSGREPDDTSDAEAVLKEALGDES